MHTVTVSTIRKTRESASAKWSSSVEGSFQATVDEAMDLPFVVYARDKFGEALGIVCHDVQHISPAFVPSTWAGEESLECGVLRG